MRLTVVLEPEADGGYSVVCPAIPGCASQGDSLKEALANIREAIVLCLEVRREDQLPAPHETPEIIAREIQECLEDRADEGLPLTIETREVEVEAEVAA
ncbi:MAG: type II toxin-antitoxin system HicB family antitoxin [Chloroflexi bacterium]|nr:type II toxin-antitoxin system HicB family antitoxin [Chloroflexota bacterium]